MSTQPKKTTTDTTANQQQQNTALSDSSTQQNQQTLSNTAVGPWAEAARYFPSLYSAGSNAFGQVQNLTPPTQFIAGPTQNQVDALTGMSRVAPTLGSAAPSLMDMAKKISSGFFLDPSNDPTFAGAANAAISPVTQNLREKVLPGIIGNAISAGGAGNGPAAYGGDALGLTQETALRDWGKTAGDITASMANASRNAGLSLIPQAPGIASAADTASLLPSTTLGAVGTQQRQFSQDALTNELQRFQMAQSAPWSGVDQMLKLLTTGGFTTNTGQTGTTGGSQTAGTVNTSGTTNATQNRVETGAAPDLMTQILQGLTGGAGIASSLFATPAAGASAASGIGSALSSLGPMLLALSDRRTKENIVQIGTMFDGTPLYRYNYKFSDQVLIGPMADEVEAKYPEAVKHVAGLAFVNLMLATKASEKHHG